jgi:hypothetical protein
MEEVQRMYDALVRGEPEAVMWWLDSIWSDPDVMEQ